MKTRFYSILCAALVLGTVSCSKEVSPVVEEKPAVVSLTAGFDDVKTTVANDGKVAWAEGDQLWVKCGSETAIFTLDPADAGKNVGKFTTTSVMDFTVGSNLEAYYPAEVGNNGSPVWPAEQTYAENMGCPMHATATIATEGTAPQLSFKNLGSVLRLSIGTSETGKKVESVTVTSSTPLAGAFSVDADNKAVITGTQTSITLNCGEEGIVIGTTPKTINVAVPANATSTDVYKDFYVSVNCTDGTFADSSMKDLSTSLKRNTAYDNNTFAAAAFLPVPENCYIVAPGTEDFTIATNRLGHDVRIDKTLAAAKGAKVVWESNNTATAPEVGSIITDLKFNGSSVTFSTGAVGNACIAVTDGANGTGNILCGWHIWVVDPADVEDVTCTDGTTVFMGRTLGAVSDIGQGLGYQQGRKDPVVGTIGYANAVRMAATYDWFAVDFDLTESNYSTDRFGVNSTLECSFAIPGRNFTAKNESLVKDDWYTKDGGTTFYELWNNKISKYTKIEGKSVFDPCPAGYRVPCLDEIAAFCAGPTSFTSPTVTLANGEVIELVEGRVNRTGGIAKDNANNNIYPNAYWSYEKHKSASAISGRVTGFDTKGVYKECYLYRSFTCLQVRCVKM